ncbi:MAG: hypothetical protein AAGB26_01845 [Planctomycetota bacterium]
MKASLTKRLLIAGLLAVPMSLTAGTAIAQCKNGKCDGGPNNLEVALGKVESAASTMSNADLQTAYDRIETLAEEVDDLNAASNSKVRNGLRELASELEKRASSEFKDALDRYFEGYYEESLAKFEELADLKGLPSAKKAQQELNKEDDRVAWRLASEQAAKFISNEQYVDARMPLNDMQRLARRTNYSSQTAASMKSFAGRLTPTVEAAEKLIAQEQYEEAYTTLIEISRLSHARESAVAARKMLAENARIEGMKLAKVEYEATQALAKAKTWYAEINNPSNNEQQLYQQKLEAIAKSFSGTAAAQQAEKMLLADNAQAAR